MKLLIKKILATSILFTIFTGTLQAETPWFGNNEQKESDLKESNLKESNQIKRQNQSVVIDVWGTSKLDFRTSGQVVNHMESVGNSLISRIKNLNMRCEEVQLEITYSSSKIDKYYYAGQVSVYCKERNVGDRFIISFAESCAQTPSEACVEVITKNPEYLNKAKSIPMVKQLPTVVISR